MFVSAFQTRSRIVCLTAGLFRLHHPSTLGCSRGLAHSNGVEYPYTRTALTFTPVSCSPFPPSNTVSRHCFPRGAKR
ncbi:hypothetical protein P154DRAFT_516695 [Amniculicola lignicola CBS 123094]|uniref:Uncharacterized protein n=1 Tax=Amniculicola lignicola CBS 123094 TaxID=1392246 RepID=A0A6A5X4R8_9PLEO|nr:hypothetical protein P154DRAFT_516695 [Amniculicola lignicola CBS 123094]